MEMNPLFGVSVFQPWSHSFVILIFFVPLSFLFFSFSFLCFTKSNANLRLNFFSLLFIACCVELLLNVGLQLSIFRLFIGFIFIPFLLFIIIIFFSLHDLTPPFDFISLASDRCRSSNVPVGRFTGIITRLTL